MDIYFSESMSSSVSKVTFIPEIWSILKHNIYNVKML